MDDTAAPGTIESVLDQMIQPEEPEQEPEALEPEAAEEEPEVEESEETDEPEVDADDEGEVEEDEESDEAEDESAPAITVTIDGNEEQVTLDELKRGYAGQQSITKRFQELSAQRKETEQVYTSLLQAQGQIAQLYQQLQSGGIPQAPVEPSRDLMTTDFIGYMEAKVQYDEQKAAYDEQMAQMASASQQQQAAQQQAMNAYLQREQEALTTLIPEFADPQTATKLKEQMVQVGSEVYGYSGDELSQVMDHRAIRVLVDAMKYQEIVAGKEKAVEKSKPKNRKPLKPGVKKAASSKTQKQKQLRSKLQHSGSLEDAANYLLS